MAGLLRNFVSPDTLEEWKENFQSVVAFLQDRRVGMAVVGVGAGMLVYTTRKSLKNENEILQKEEALANYPSLWNHSNLMAKHLTPDLYAKLLSYETSSGFGLDQAIQPGVDNPSHPHICVTGLHPARALSV